MAFEKFMKFLTARDDDEYADEYYDDEPVAEEETESKGYNLDDVYSTRRETPRRNEGKVVNMIPGGQMQVVLVKPDRFEDAPSIADHLNAKRSVVINLEKASKDMVRRLVDFLSGAAYANGAQIKRVANNTFMITPSDVNILGDMLMDEADSYR
jgi:cell division inhibitor SepF